MDLARDCACKAWHLCDHVFKTLGSNPGLETLGVLKDHAKGTCPELAYLQDMCNEAKHGKLKRYWSRMDEAKFQDGNFSHRDFDPHDFDVPRLEIKVKDGQPVLFSDVVDRVIADAGLAQSIPLQVEALGTVRLRYPRVADQHWRLQNDRFCDT